MQKTGNSFGSTKVSRRDFGRSIAGLGIAGVVAEATPGLGESESVATSQGKTNLSANQGSSRECDVLIKGGMVIDPSQRLHAVLDVAMKGGKILEVSPDFPEERARTVVWAKDKIVTPGFVDIFAHVFDGVTRNAVNADLNCLVKGTTTVVDGGSAGWPSVAGLQKYVINTSATRVHAAMNLSALGEVSNVGVMQNLAWINPELTAKVAEENKPAVVGLKVQMGGQLDDGTESLELECLKRGLQVAEACHFPMLVRYLNLSSGVPPFLKMLRRGDVLTHIYNRSVSILDTNGKILPEVREARQRGVLFDVGHGLAHFVFDEAEKCLQQDFPPDTISTCLVAAHPYKPYEVSTDLPAIVSELMALGLDLDKVIEMVTAKPAQVFNYGLELGTLRPGSEADISIFELREGQFTFVDYTGGKRTGRQRLLPVATMRSGRLFETTEQFHDPFQRNGQRTNGQHWDEGYPGSVF